MKIDLDNGKYTVVVNDDTERVESILRYGQPWPASDDLLYSKVVLAMIHEIIELKKQLGASDDHLKEPVQGQPVRRR